MLTDLLNRRYTGLLISLFVLTVVYVPVCYSDYAFLDEAHQLWHNNDHSNYSMFLVQGRWLSGLLFDKVFSMISKITDLKFLRLFSFFSWALLLIAWFHLGNKWRTLVGFNNLLLVAGGVYIACSLPVTIYIGWSSCFQAGLATLLALWSGSIVFSGVITKQSLKSPFGMQLIVAILLGLMTLFLYQIAFGAFLIPFVLYLVAKKTAAKPKILYWGVAAYLVITILYYALFIFSIHHAEVVASGRTDFSFDVLGKLSFFFGLPLSQASSFNFLYNTHSILSQAFPFVMILLWLIAWARIEKAKPANKITLTIGFIVLCMFIYLPLLVGKENFSSYRTMFSFSLAVSLLLTDAIILWVKPKIQTLAITGMMVVFIIAACWNYNFNFSRPLRQEYKLLGNELTTIYHPGIDTIFFLRPPEDAFLEPYGINSYKDEFGVPSTFKDWTPEPLIKQMLWEKTKSRSLAEKLVIIQFTDKAAFETDVKSKTPQAIYIDGAALFHKNP